MNKEKNLEEETSPPDLNLQEQSGHIPERSEESIDVLWIDDEHEDQVGEIIIESAEKNGITLKGVDCGYDGIEELRLRYDKYDAVLLDVQSKFHKNDSAEFSNYIIIQRHIEQMMAGKIRKPILTLSAKCSDAQKKMIESDKLFLKTPIVADQDISIWEEFKRITRGTDSKRIKQKYSNLIELGKKIDFIREDTESVDSTEKMILSLAMHLEEKLISDDPFLQIRKIMDSIFLYLNRIGKGNEGYINENNSPNLTSAYQYFQSQQDPIEDADWGIKGLFYKKMKNDLLKEECEKYGINFRLPFFNHTLKGNEINPKPWPTDISEIAYILLGKGTPVHGRNHLQKKDSKKSHFQNVRDNKYFSYAYINLLFTFLLWFNEEYLNE
jgi:hypothetical protein